MLIEYESFFPSSVAITIPVESTDSTTPAFFAIITTPESTAALYSIPVPTIGASVVIRGTA